MTHRIFKCPSCSKYTMNKVCSKCGRETVLPRPPKFSLDDKYAGLRREEKRKSLVEKQLL